MASEEWAMSRKKHHDTLHVIARCPDKGMVLLGGVGFSGTGRWWREDSEDRQKYRGYRDAPIVSSEAEAMGFLDDFGCTPYGKVITYRPIAGSIQTPTRAGESS
jgi:hypothetical protein